MGCFGYICKKCGTPVNGNELCIMKHVRHSEVLGAVVGHYNEYGGVVEQEGQKNAFRGEDNDDMNSHYEICKSEFDMNDSRDDEDIRMYKEEPVSAHLYQIIRGTEILEKSIDQPPDESLKAIKSLNSDEFKQKCLDEFGELPPLPKPETWSGVVAWHKKCYDEATEEDRNDLKPSDSDPEQSWGEAREEFK